MTSPQEEILQFNRARKQVQADIVNAVQHDPRLVGLVDYGSSSEGRSNPWSDLDLALFIADEHLLPFSESWQSWITGFAPVLLAYTSGVGHPWAVLDIDPEPLRIDLNFIPQSRLDEVLTWPCSPISVPAMVLYDGTNGRLSGLIEKIVAQSLVPTDPQAAFDTICGDLWYYLLRIRGKLRRAEFWLARWEFNFIVTGNLIALLKLEAGATSRWRGSSAPAELEQWLAPQRLARLQKTIPGHAPNDLWPAMAAAAHLGRDSCAAIAQKEGWPWPAELADRLCHLLENDLLN